LQFSTQHIQNHTHTSTFVQSNSTSVQMDFTRISPIFPQPKNASLTGIHQRLALSTTFSINIPANSSHYHKTPIINSPRSPLPSFHPLPASLLVSTDFSLPPARSRVFVNAAFNNSCVHLVVHFLYFFKRANNSHKNPTKQSKSTVHFTVSN
jgi:hypothetical protein